MISYNAKGISPLLATVILLAFSIALGAVVMNFTRGGTNEYIETATQHLETSFTCDFDLSVRVLDINNIEQICYNRSGLNNLEVVLENQGTKETKGMRFLVLDYESKILQKDVMISLGPHNRTRYSFNIEVTDNNSSFTTPPSKVTISPIISSERGKVVCNNNAIEIITIPEC